jgi:hypothetical protein
MPDAKNRGIMKLGTREGVDLNAAVASEMTLWTCPIGKSGAPTEFVFRDPTGDAANSVATIGLRGGNCNEILSDITLSGLDAVDKVAIVRPVPAMTPVVQDVITAGQEVALEITTQAGGACVVTIDTFGYEWDV